MNAVVSFPPIARAAVVGPAVQFHTTKYGREFLVDVAWVRDMPTFILDAAHRLAFYDVTLVTRGSGVLTIDGNAHRVKPGVVLFTAPGQLRQWRVNDFDGICVFFPALFLDEFFRDTLFLQRLAFFRVPAEGAAMSLGPRAAQRLRARLELMRREFSRLRPDSAHLLRARVYELLIALERSYRRSCRGSHERAPHQLPVRYLQLIDQHVVRQKRVAAYAEMLAVTTGYLNVLCKRHLGRSAKALISDRLTLEARRMLLYSDESTARIAHALGFDDPSYFARFFAEHTGRSPSAFRAAHRDISSLTSAFADAGPRPTDPE